MSSNAESAEDVLVATRERLQRVMRGFETLSGDTAGYARVIGRPYQRFMLDRKKFPVPAILRVVFDILGYENLGRAEKLAWEYTFSFEGSSCSLAFEKFGLRLYVSADAKPDPSIVEKRIAKALHAGQQVVERGFLKPLGLDQMRKGNITVRNQYGNLYRAYEYFREGAVIAYAGAGRLMKTPPPGGGFWLMPKEDEAWWNIFAMVMAYFSLFEHVLVGCLAFSGFDPEAESVNDFIGKNWGEKFKRIFDVSIDRTANRRYLALKEVAEAYRNTYGHGGFDKKSSTVYFHIPGVGAVPGNLTAIRATPHFGFVPTSADDFGAICRLFDDTDTWLSSGPLANALTWITGGLDYRFDAKFREQLHEAGDDFDGFMDYHSYLADQTANMDW
jgi:hypothetical protein